jgi:hypothetical protein
MASLLDRLCIDQFTIQGLADLRRTAKTKSVSIPDPWASLDFFMNYCSNTHKSQDLYVCVRFCRNHFITNMCVSIQKKSVYKSGLSLIRDAGDFFIGMREACAPELLRGASRNRKYYRESTTALSGRAPCCLGTPCPCLEELSVSRKYNPLCTVLFQNSLVLATPFRLLIHFLRHTVRFSVVGHTHVACGYPASGHARVAGAVKVYETNRSVVSD